jgi:hypothetical protein
LAEISEPFTCAMFPPALIARIKVGRFCSNGQIF